MDGEQRLSSIRRHKEAAAAVEATQAAADCSELELAAWLASKVCVLE